MQTTSNRPSSEPPLSHDDLIALKQACGPVGLLTFPPIESIRSLRQKGYITIVLGGVQITPLGLERLLRERHRVHTSLARADVQPMINCLSVRRISRAAREDWFVERRLP